MPADISTSLKDWSTSAGSNQPTGSTAISTNLDDNLREIQAVVRAAIASADTIASASTCDIGSKDAGTLTVTGTTTITSLGTVSAGITKKLIFEGALTLTHNGTSLILPNGGSNITTAAGDTAEFVSLGSGNWRCLDYTRANGNNVANASTFSDGSASTPGIAFTSDLDTGIYRSATNTLNVSAGGTSRLQVSDTAVTITTPLTVNPTGGAVTIAPAGASTPGAVSITGGSSSSATAGGNVTIQGGPNTSSGAGGNAVLKPGEGTGGGYGSVELWGRGLGSRAVFRIKGQTNNAEFVSQGDGDPEIASGGGTSPSIAGPTNAFRITLGSSPGTTAVVVTFGAAFSAAPIAIAQYQSDHIALRCVTTATDVTITPASSMTAGHIIEVLVFGKAAS